MVDQQTITDLCERIAAEFQPERIILFGSHAYGNPTDASDVDLLVIFPFQGSAIRKAVEILDKVHPRFAVDLLVRTPEQVRQRLAWNDFFLREIIENGKVVYESPHA